MSPAASFRLDPIEGGRFIVAGDPRLMGWVARRITTVPNDYVWPQAEVIGLTNGSEMLAAMIVHDYVPAFRNCQITFAAASPKWATKSSIRALLRYPFEQLGCRRVTTIIPARNVRAIRFNEGIGFKREGVIRFGAGDQDEVILGLLKEEAPTWLGFTCA